SWGKRSDHAVEFVEQGKIRRGLLEVLELSGAFLAHRKTQSLPDSTAIITFSSPLRNVRRQTHPKCSTAPRPGKSRKFEMAGLRRKFKTPARAWPPAKFQSQRSARGGNPKAQDPN